MSRFSASTSNSSRSQAVADTMAETQSAPMLTSYPFPDYAHRRPPHSIRLPPLDIPPPPPLDQSHRDYLPPPRIHQLEPNAPQTAIRSSPVTDSRRRQSLSRGAPLADLLSPRLSTASRSESGYSPQYELRRSPPRSIFESPSAHRYQPSIDEHSRPTITREASYASSVDATYRQQRSVIPSPTQTPTYDTSSSGLRTRYGIQSGPIAPPSSASIPEPSRGVPPTTVPPSSRTTGQTKLPLQYELKLRQQPIAARACGFGERDRRVIDPPPIIQLIARDLRTGAEELDELRYSLYIVHCTLWNSDGTTEETALQQPDRRTTRRLMGQLVASPSVAKDEHDVEGCFFCFPDLSCRTHGQYRLRFVLIRLDPANMKVGSFSPILTEVLSNVFTVYTAKDFPGMRPSSALTRALKLQGCNIQVKKGNERAITRKRQSLSDHDEGEEDHDHAAQTKRQRFLA